MINPVAEKKMANTPWSHLGDIDRIVDSGLCTRCGACAVCPYGAISWNEKSYPVINHDACPECGLCMAVCPGESINIPQLAQTIFDAKKEQTEHPLGVIRKASMAYSNKEEVRSKGAGGGVVSQILIDLLSAGEINGAVVTRSNPQRPWQSEPFVATNAEEIKQSTGSRYTIVPVLAIIPKLQKMKGRYAVVCLPCQAEGIRLLQKVIPYWAEKIWLVISLYCGTNWELAATTELAKNIGAKKEEITKLEYRAGVWPGEFQVTTNDGKIHTITKLIFNYLRFMYMPNRCSLCVDMAGEISDLSIGDAWLKSESGKYEFPACSTIIVRSEKGENVLDTISKRGALTLLPIAAEDLVRQHQPGINSKKLIAHQRINKTRGPRPDYGIKAAENLSARDKLGVIAYGYALRFAQIPLIRYLALKFLTTKLGIWTMHQISRLREKLKLSMV